MPIGIFNCGQSQTKIQTWIPREGLEGAEDEYTKWQLKTVKEAEYGTPEYESAMAVYSKKIEEWVATCKEEAKKKLAPVSKPPAIFGNIRRDRDISWMHNGKMSSVVPYAIRGFIWNQGYANSKDGFVYYHNLHALIRGWRKLWGNESLPVYFHQFYTPGDGNDELTDGSVVGTANEMRMGTSLARDIPNTGMASQIDIGGAIHYGNKIMPGRRLALHALKNQYAKDVVADGPFFKSHSTDGEKLIVEFENAKGGLVVGRTSAEVEKKGKTRLKMKKIAEPDVIPNGDTQITIFYITDESRKWKRAEMKIDGEKVILTAPDVKEPCGVAYAVNGVALLPNVYNKAMLPLSPFVYFKNELQTSKWEKPEEVKFISKPITKTSVLLQSRGLQV